MFNLKRGERSQCCPHCGEQVPSARRCRACGMRMNHWLRKDVIRFLLFVGFVGSLFLIQVICSGLDPKRVRIREINPLLNFWTVRVEGELLSDARVLKSGSLFYVIDDGTGRLAVFDPEVSQRGQLKAGRSASVVGTLQVGAGNNRRLQAREVNVLADESDPGGRGLSRLHFGMIGDFVSVTGKVVRCWAPKEGSRAPHKIIIEDRSAELDVVHWLSDAPDILIGDTVHVSGRVSEYRNKLQLKVTRSSGLQVLEQEE